LSHDEPALTPLLYSFASTLAIRARLGLRSRLGAGAVAGGTGGRPPQMEGFFPTRGHALQRDFEFNFEVGTA
jgi:hypothetical protein